MKKLLIYLKAYRKEACLAPIFKMLEAVFELFVPLVIKGIIDYGIAAEDRAYCLRMGLLLLLLAVIGLAMATTAQWFSAKAAAGFAAKIKQVLMEHIQKLSYTELDTIGTSTLITRMTSDVGSQVIVNGTPLKNMPAKEYFQYKKKLIPDRLCRLLRKLPKRICLPVMVMSWEV